MRLSARAKGIKISSTLAIANRTAELRAQGVDVLSFGMGEPDFGTPDHVCRAGIDAINAGHTGYAKPASGIAVVREAICERFQRVHGVTYTPKQVMTTVGGKEGVALALQALLGPGDEAIVHVPYWVSYPQMVFLSGATMVPLLTTWEDGFRIRPEQLAGAISERTRVLLLNYPSNPAGTTYGEAELRALAKVLAPHDITVVSDEMYDEIVFDGHEHVAFAALSREMYERTVTINAGSKTYAMTGWRAGYAAGPAELIGAMARLQSQTTTGVATFTQYALAAALTGPQACVAERRAEFQERGKRMVGRLSAMKDVQCVAPEGAFYCFPHVAGTYARLGVGNSIEFVEKLIDECRVAVIPGEGFGADEHVRISFSCSAEQIDKGMDRLEKLLGRAG